MSPNRPASRTRAALPRLPLLLLFLFAPGAPAARAETVWVDGFELEVTLHSGQALLGEPVSLSLELTNRSETDLELMLSGEAGRGWPDDFEVSVAGSDGAPAPGPPAGAEPEGLNTIILRAGQSLNIPLRLDHWARFTAPGLYAVTCRRGLRAAPFDGRQTVLLDVEKPAVEFRVRAEVEVKPGADRLGQLIEELGPALVGPPPSSGMAARRLSQLGDPRVLRHFLEAYRKAKDAGVRYTALDVFSKFNHELALEGLKLGASDPNDDFRTAAAVALSSSKHPEAARLLAEMRRDPYFGVRLVVLYALEGMKGAAARRMIWEMTNDPHEAVKTEALRFLHSGATPRP